MNAVVTSNVQQDTPDNVKNNKRRFYCSTIFDDEDSGKETQTEECVRVADNVKSTDEITLTDGVGNTDKVDCADRVGRADDEGSVEIDSLTSVCLTSSEQLEPSKKKEKKELDGCSKSLETSTDKVDVGNLSRPCTDRVGFTDAIPSQENVNSRLLFSYLTDPSWKQKLGKEFEKPYFEKLSNTIVCLANKQVVYPPLPQVFTAFNLCPINRVRVVIIGQDPYVNGSAVGLAFSVKSGMPINPSLKNILKELATDIGTPSVKQRLESQNGDLTSWAQQGVLLLNTVLTVAEGMPNSHSQLGWESFTNAALRCLNEQSSKVFIFWGMAAAEKTMFVDSHKHCILKSAHPSPKSADRGFFGSRPFSKTNTFLRSKGFDPICWD